jgi:hypothetical protein
MHARRYAVVLAIVIAACKGDDPRAKIVEPPPIVAPARIAEPPVARPEAAKPGSPQAWFDDYRAAHEGATAANAIDTGKKLWPMLASDAAEMLRQQATTTLATLKATVAITAEDLGYKLLGETAATRAAAMHDAKIVGDDPRPERVVSGKSLVSRMLHVRGAGTTIDLPIVADGGSWKLAVGPSLVASDTEVFRAPATGSDAPVGLPTLDGLAARWKQVIATGNGWDALNIMSPAMRKRVLELVSQMGGTGMPDVARIFEKTIVDRRNRGITVESMTIEDRTDDRGSIVMKYSDGKSETFTGVRVAGVWWVEAKL